MKRVLLRVAYDGTNYHGWQIQPGATTVEGVLNHALSKLTGEEIIVIGASRTDSGVHARGNVAVFDTESTIPPERFSYAVNTILPDDVSVVKSFEVPGDFHPRKTDTEKTYEYTILNTKFPVPERRNYSWHVPQKLNIDKMRAAASPLIGQHDFRGFCSSKTQAESTVRIIYSINVRREGDEIKITVKGNGFLYNMVRIIAGTLASAGGLGKVTPEKVQEAIIKRDRTIAGLTAPPQGLCLMEIDFLELEYYMDED